MAALRRSGLCEQHGAPRGAPYVACCGRIERPGPAGKPCRCAAWTAGEDPEGADGSVSSGRLSGSSGGHEPCAPPRGPRRERPPCALGSLGRHRESNPRLERLRDKIRAQARGQASCASLGTSMPSSASHTHGAFSPAARRLVQKPTKPPPAPAYPGVGNPSATEPCRASRLQASALREMPKSMKSSSCTRGKTPKSSTGGAARDKGSELVGVYAWRKGQTLARGLLGPPPARPRLQNKAPSREPAPELGDTENAGAAESSPTRPRTPSPASTCSDRQVPAHTPSLASYDQAVTIQSALAILQDLRRQIQTGLELARHSHLSGGRERRPSSLGRQDLAGRKHGYPWSAPDVRASVWKNSQLRTKGTCPSLERAGSFPAGQRWRTLATWESYPRTTWSAQGRDPTSQRPGSPPEGLSCAPGRPWSAAAGQRARATCEDWGAPARGPWNLLERPRSPVQLPGSGSCRKSAWPRPAPSSPGIASGKESEARPPPPCPKPRGALGHPYSAQSLREFMRRKALARRQQALEEKAAAARALERRDQRLQAVYRKQREAVLGRGAPQVSQVAPSIVTFVPHPVQSRSPETPGSLGASMPQWSKVTSGMVLGDQEAPGSFCLFLNRALNGTETLETEGPQEGWKGAPLRMSASSPRLGRPELRGLATQPPPPGLCIYLDPEEAERLGTTGPLHFRYKRARLQALETMAGVLKRRIDTLTAKLLGSEAADAVGDLDPGPPPSHPSTVSAAPTPVVPARSGALVPNWGGGAPWDWADLPAGRLLSPTGFLDGETLPPWRPGRGPQPSVSPGGHPAYEPPGSVEDRRSELDRGPARSRAASRARSLSAGSSLGVPAPPDPTCSSLWLEETPAAPGAGLVTPWSLQSCGGRAPGQPRGGHLSDIQQKSLGFLRSLKLEQQKQQRALALLRQQAELEVRETQRAREELLARHQPQRLLGKHAAQAGPGTASKLEGPQACGDPHLKASPSAVTARPRRVRGRWRPALGRGSPEGGWESQTGKSASAEPTQEGRPGRAPSQAFHRGGDRIHRMLGRSPREQELHAQHSLRRTTLVETSRPELAWLERGRRCLGSVGDSATLMASAGQQELVLSGRGQEQGQTRPRPSGRLPSPRERARLLEQHRDVTSVQRSLARLWQALRRPGPEVQAAWERGSETSWRSEAPTQGPPCPPTPHRAGSPVGHPPRRRPKSPRVPPLVTEQRDGTPPGGTSAADGHPEPPRPAWGAETRPAAGWPDPPQRLAESGSSPLGRGNPQAEPRPPTAEEETRALTESQQGTEGSPVAGPPEAGNQRPEERRAESCGPESPQDDASSRQETVRLSACPAAPAAEATAPIQRPGSPRPPLTAAAALGSPAESAPGTCSGTPVGSCTPSSGSSLSCPSLPGFQEVSALLVQLSQSSTSLSDWAPGNTPDADVGWSGGSSPRDSGGLHRGGGRATWEAPAGSGPESEPGLLWADRPPLPATSSPRSGSELSLASSKVWDEESPPEPGEGAQPATGHSLPADPEEGGQSGTMLPPLGPGGGQEASRSACGSLTSGSDTGKARRTSPAAARTASPPATSSRSDLDPSLPFPSGSSASKEGDFSERGETGLLPTSAGGPEGPLEADPRPPQAPPGAPSVPTALRAESWAPGHGGSGAHAAAGEARPAPGSGVLPEILSPVGEVLSHGSADLLSSAHTDTRLPPPPPILPADGGDPPGPPLRGLPFPARRHHVPRGLAGPPGGGRLR